MCVVVAAELGLHGLVVQSKSRGDDNHPIGGGGGRERKGSGADVSYTPLHLCKHTILTIIRSTKTVELAPRTLGF